LSRSLQIVYLNRFYRLCKLKTEHSRIKIELAIKRAFDVAEATYEATEGDGRFGSLDELMATNPISKDMLQRQGYRIELTVSGRGLRPLRCLLCM
jgi:hypothetical protein